jgi:magnesium transporter
MKTAPGGDPPAKITITNYNAKGVQEVSASTAEECLSFIKDKKKTTWINIDGLDDQKLLNDLASMLELHPLVLEDMLHTRQRPKMEDYDDYLYIVVRMIYLDEKSAGVKSEQISIILGKNYVVSLQEKKGDIFEKIRERLRKGKGRARRMGPDFLTYSMLDMIVDHYFVILEKIGEKTESMEEAVVKDPSPRMLQRIRALKREMLAIRKSVWPLRELLLAMERESRSKDSLVKKETAVYLRDVYDHTIQVIDTTETLRDMASGMVDIYLSSISNRMNEVMKVLTVIGTIFIPLTFITGLYGMNFMYMPELEHPFGYFAVLLGMFLIGLIMVMYFKKRKWL